MPKFRCSNNKLKPLAADIRIRRSFHGSNSTTLLGFGVDAMGIERNSSVTLENALTTQEKVANILQTVCKAQRRRRDASFIWSR